jgi:hypothetical protein
MPPLRRPDQTLRLTEMVLTQYHSRISNLPEYRKL